MQTRCMERTNSMKGRGKRRLESEDDGGEEEDRKRPALASVIAEALKVDNLQKLFSSLEPILRRVVSEEVERALAKLGPARLNGRTSPKQIEGQDRRSLQLRFKSRLSLPLFTGGKVEGEQGAAIHVVLIDADTGHVVTSGAESSVKLDVVVLDGDFNNEDDEGWSQDEFESHMVKEREGKRPLLTGDLQVALKEGIGTLGDLSFTDNSSWIRSRKFRLGLKAASGYSSSARIREAKTEAFTVKDHRGELYKKHYPPAFNDDVWRLEKIGKDGSFHKRLNNARIYTVQDFLRLLVRDSQKLRSILGSGMSNKMWDALIEHSKTCVLSGMLYVYYPDDARHVGVVFNNIYELNGLINDGQYYPADSLSDMEKVRVDIWVKKAYEDWSQVVEYDGKSLFDFKQSKKLIAPSQNDFSFGPFDNHLQPPLEVSSLHPRILAGNPEYLIDSSSDMFEPLSSTHPVTHQNQIQNATMYENPVNLVLGPPQASLNLFEDWSGNRDKGVNDFLSEEEIRLRSHEILENEDMQQLLRLFSMGGGSNATPDGDYNFSYAPEQDSSSGFSYSEDRARPGRAVAGWLKIKAAMRWGIFVRKKAAERRRARLVELEDE